MTIGSLVVLAQSKLPDDTPPPVETTSAAAAAIFGVFALVGIISIVGVASKGGRRTVLPLVAILLGVSIVVTTISEANINSISPITALGLFFGALIAIGGFGAMREGLIVPEVEGVEPSVDGSPRPGAQGH